MDHWMLVGHFNLIRSPHDRNRPGGDTNNMLMFNSLLQQQDLVEIPIKGRNFTWSNMQDSPLLEKLAWIFTSANWTLTFPNTLAHPLARVTSVHIPIHIQIGSDIPKSSIFRFENYWFEFDGFYETVVHCWNRNQQLTNSAKDTAARFKCLRMG